AAGTTTWNAVGTAVGMAGTRVRRQLLEIAAQELEADPRDLAIDEGEVHVRGVRSRGVSIAELAERSLRYDTRYRPLYGQGQVAALDQSPMFTVHVARVAVDTDTGGWNLTGYGQCRTSAMRSTRC